MSVAARLARSVRHVRSLGWTMVDQGLFTLSNLLITIAVGRGGGSETLGRYATAFATYLLVLAIYRALIAEPLLAQNQTDRRHESERSAVTLTLMFSAAAALLTGVVGVALENRELVMMAAALPAVLLQDILRFQALQRKAPRIAVMSDGAWVVGSLAAWTVVTRVPSSSVAVACWAVGGFIGALVCWRLLGSGMAFPKRALTWWRRDTRGLATPLLVNGVLTSVSTQAVIFVIGGVAGSNALGVVRAGQVYFGSFMVAFAAIGVFLTPRLAQRAVPPDAGTAMRLSIALAAVAAVFCAAVLLAESPLHTILYAGSIEVPRRYMVPLALQTVLTAASGAWMAVATATRNLGSVVRWRLRSTVLGLVALVVGIHEFGVVGALWMQAAQFALYLAGLMCSGFRQRQRDRRSTDGSVHVGRSLAEPGPLGSVG